MPKSGRPTKLTGDVSAAIAAAVRAGAPLATAAAAAGVGERTVYRWLELARRPGRRFAAHRALARALERARAQRQLELVGRITAAGPNGDWRASAWWLQHEFPERWGPPGRRAELDHDWEEA